MRGGLAGRHATSTQRSGRAIATHSQERFANCSDSKKPPSQRHDDLAEMLVGFHVLERLADVLEFVDLVDRQLQLAAFHCAPDVLADLVEDLTDLLDGPGAKGHADI